MYTSTELLTRILNTHLFAGTDSKFAIAAGYKGRSTITAFRKALISPNDGSDRMANTIITNLISQCNSQTISNIENILTTAELLGGQYEFSHEKFREILFSDFSDLDSEIRHRLLNIKTDDFEAFYMGAALYFVEQSKVRVSERNFHKTAAKYSALIDRIIRGKGKHKFDNIDQKKSVERFTRAEVSERFHSTVYGLISLLGSVIIQQCDARRMIEKLMNLGEIVPQWPQFSFWTNPENDSEIWNFESTEFSNKTGLYELAKIPNDLDYRKIDIVRMAVNKTSEPGIYKILLSRHPDTYLTHSDHSIADCRAMISESEIRFLDEEHTRLGLPNILLQNNDCGIRKLISDKDLGKLITRGSCHYAGIEIDTSCVIADVMVSRVKVVVIVRKGAKVKEYTFRKSDYAFLRNIRPDDIVYVGRTCQEPEKQKLIWIKPGIFAVEI